jgi:carbon-monoxide dehydrogenase small subunit
MINRTTESLTGEIIMEATSAKEKLKLTINGNEYIVECNVNETLAEVLRERLGLTGLKIGCDSGECGACTVLVNGQPILSCLTLAIDCQEKEILTIEGLENTKTGELHPIQQAFVEHHGTQCGYCTPGMIMAAKALLDKNLAPTEEEVREALNGNLCRCTGYISIIESILAAAEKMRKERVGKR